MLLLLVACVAPPSTSDGHPAQGGAVTEASSDASGSTGETGDSGDSGATSAPDPCDPTGWTRRSGELHEDQLALATFDGDITGVTPTSDLTGDGAEDWWVDETEHPVEGSMDGVVYLVPGPVSGTVDAASVATVTIHETDGPSDALFRLMPGAGDLTGDGAPDLLFLGTSFAGAFVLDAAPAPGTWRIDELAPILLTGPIPRPAGDLTGDGIGDLVQVDRYDGTFAPSGGLVERAPGPFGADTVLHDVADLSFYGTREGATLDVGDPDPVDLDADGVDDWVLWAYIADTRSGLYVFSAPAPGTHLTDDATTTIDADAGGLYRPVHADWDGDGATDLALQGNVRFTQRDAILILPGPVPPGLVDAADSAVAILDHSDASLPRAAVDLDQDGFPELLTYESAGNDGILRVVWGPIAGEVDLEDVTGIELVGGPGDYLGMDVVPLTDLDGDCGVELAVSASRVGEGGSMYVLPSSAFFGP